MSDDDLKALKWGGHDQEKLYAAFKEAKEHKGAPSLILVKTVKGFGMGSGGMAKNINHQKKSLSEDDLKYFVNRFNIPIDEKDVHKLPFYRPEANSPEIKYLKEQRNKLGGPLPREK